ncbi:hypothetical protein [Falsiphaeobacter marinintestinus]|uniref:hypothetical protein n=1 Tax=Falsiphaeobacter marinintestinus TaxID=1492905 RepID=UPI001646B1C7|nr:hypothetical protein [Phaeobacter marinintestinus]
MGFPYDEASWSVVDGAMFMGWGSAMPGFFTLIAALICLAVLVFGQKTEAAKTRQFEK